MNKPHASIAAFLTLAVVLSGTSIALAEGGGDQGGQMPPRGQLPPPPPGGRGEQDRFGRDDRGDRPQNIGNGTTSPGLRIGQREERGQRNEGDDASSSPEGRPVPEQQLQRMLRQSNLITGLLTRGEKQLQAAQTRLQKQGLSLSTECTTALSDMETTVAELKGAKDTSNVKVLFENAAESQDTVRTCQRQAMQLSQASTIFKTMQKMIDRLKAAKVDVTQLQDTFNSDVQPSFSALKSSDVTDDDIATFFDAASNFRDDLLSAFDDNGIAEPRELKGSGDLQPARGSGPQSLNVKEGLANLGAALISVFGL